MQRILITGLGGGVGQSILKALQDTDYGLVGVDSEALAAGLHAVPAAYTGLYAGDPKYVERLIEICRAESCSLIFVGHDVELLPISEQAEWLRANGIVPVVSSPDIIRVCDDKLATHSFLKEKGFDVPETCSLRDLAT